jgi:hypothetical protein
MPDPLIATCELKTASYDMNGTPSPISLVTFTGKKILDNKIEISGSITFPETRNAFNYLFRPFVFKGPANLIPPVTENPINEVIGGTPFIPMEPINGGPAIIPSPLAFGGYADYYSTQDIPAGSTYNFKLVYGPELDFPGTYLVFTFEEPNQIFSSPTVREEVAYTLSNQSSCFGFPSSPDTFVKKTSIALIGSPYSINNYSYQEIPKQSPGITLNSNTDPHFSGFSALSMAGVKPPSYTFVFSGKISGWAKKIAEPISGVSFAQVQVSANNDPGSGESGPVQLDTTTTEPQFFELERSFTASDAVELSSIIFVTGEWQFWGLEFESSYIISGACSNEGYTSNEITLNWGPAPSITLPGTYGQSQVTDLDQMTELFPNGWSKNSFGSGIQFYHSIAPITVPSYGPARLRMSLFSSLFLNYSVLFNICIVLESSTNMVNDVVNKSILRLGPTQLSSPNGFYIKTLDLSDYLGETIYVYFRLEKYFTGSGVLGEINISDFSLSIDTCAPTPQKNQTLVWDVIGERVYENGVDRGVLYLPDGRAVVWNGLLSVEEDSGSSTQGVFYDGVKISEIVNMGDYSAKLSAITYPDELDDLQGVAQLVEDVYLTDQPLKTFGLSYRTRILDDISQEPIGYKIHIVYNVIAVPTDIGYETLSDDPSAMEFQWDLVALSGFIDGFRPTAKFVVDTTKINPDLLIELEKLLYGTSTVQPALPTMQELLEYIRTWYTIQIIDNGDGTWTATSDNDGYIFVDIPQEDQFMIVDVNATFLDDETYIISDT